MLCADVVWHVGDFFAGITHFFFFFGTSQSQVLDTLGLSNHTQLNDGRESNSTSIIYYSSAGKVRNVNSTLPLCRMRRRLHRRLTWLWGITNRIPWCRGVEDHITRDRVTANVMCDDNRSCKKEVRLCSQWQRHPAFTYNHETETRRWMGDTAQREPMISYPTSSIAWHGTGDRHFACSSVHDTVFSFLLSLSYLPVLLSIRLRFRLLQVSPVSPVRLIVHQAR